MANQKPDAGQFDDVGFLIFRPLTAASELCDKGKGLAQLSPNLKKEIPKNIAPGIRRSI
jgi:hypothetical protein